MRYTSYVTHYSQVSHSVFMQIKHGHKIIEPRVNDADHKHVRLGDLLIIIDRTTKEEVIAKIVGILRYNSFDDLFAAFPARHFGFETAEEAKREVRRWYTKDTEQTHGVLGIKLHVLRKS